MLKTYTSLPVEVEAVELTQSNFMNDYAAPKTALLNLGDRTVSVACTAPAEVGDFAILENAEKDLWYLCSKMLFEMKYALKVQEAAKTTDTGTASAEVAPETKEAAKPAKESK